MPAGCVRAFAPSPVGAAGVLSDAAAGSSQCPAHRRRSGVELRARSRLMRDCAAFEPLPVREGALGVVAFEPVNLAL
jgi:hypothetical protein